MCLVFQLHFNGNGRNLVWVRGGVTDQIRGGVAAWDLCQTKNNRYFSELNSHTHGHNTMDSIYLAPIWI